jgi:NAD(P)H-nitrite reductase large subunit
MDHPAGASHQKTFTVVTRIPGGVVTPEMLEKIAAVIGIYQVPVVKITSGQRFLLIGMREDDLAAIRRELGPLAEEVPASSVRYVQACLGTDACRYGTQDSTGLGMELEKRYHGAVYPAKIKIGVSGCLRCCGESYLRDIGLVGTRKGWTVIFGGNSGRRPSPGIVVAQDLSHADALDLVHRLLEYYKSNARPKERTARFLERIGFAQIKSDLLTLLPYIRLEDVR